MKQTDLTDMLLMGILGALLYLVFVSQQTGAAARGALQIPPGWPNASGTPVVNAMPPQALLTNLSSAMHALQPYCGSGLMPDISGNGAFFCAPQMMPATNSTLAQTPLGPSRVPSGYNILPSAFPTSPGLPTPNYWPGIY